MNDKIKKFLIDKNPHGYDRWAYVKAVFNSDLSGLMTRSEFESLSDDSLNYEDLGEYNIILLKEGIFEVTPSLLCEPILIF